MDTATEPMQAGLPGPEDVAFYAEHGWWTSGQVLPPDVLDAALLGAERHYAGERDQHLLIGGGYLDWRPEHGNVIRLNDYVSLVRAVMASETDLRMFVQQGCFTVHCVPTPLDEMPGHAAFLHALVVPQQAVRQLATELDVAGFHRGDMFPDLDHLAAELKNTYEPFSVGPIP